jgi:FkbM family methyltransferase
MNIIQIGCHDGNDHVFEFIKYNKNKIKRAILVEPLPEKIFQAKERYNCYDFVEFHECAIVDSFENAEISFFHPEDLIHSQISSINFDHVKNFRSDIKEIKVKCVNIQKFLDNLNLQKIDRLYIDTEGLDCKLIEQIDFNKYDIDYIEYEYIHSDGIHKYGENGIKIEEKLIKLGYNKILNPPFNIIFNK